MFSRGMKLRLNAAWAVQASNNRPFPSCLWPLYQNESSWETVHMEMRFMHANQTHFHKKDFARTRFETEAQSKLGNGLLSDKTDYLLTLQSLLLPT